MVTDVLAAINVTTIGMVNLADISLVISQETQHLVRQIGQRYLHSVPLDMVMVVT